MTTALYRRYRPETFADVIGQEHVTEPLMAALDADRVTHAYLFSGPRGCGKTTSARIFARCLNCAEGPTATPCGACDSCVDLARGGSGSLDVVEMDAASHGGVDDARDLRERAVFAPARDRFKVFIIDEAHMVSNQGFNALLKLVEEPPEHVKFVFATTEPDKVIGTIRSRTHHYPFRLVAPQRLEQYLEELCTAESISVAAGVLPLVVRAGGGSVRDSLSVLDQLMAGAQAGSVSYERAVSLLGYTPSALLDDVVDALAARDGATVFKVIDRVVDSGHDPRRFTEDLLERLRDLVVIAVAGEQAESVLRALPRDQVERMHLQAQHLGAAQLSRAADLVHAALGGMAGATSPRLQLELLGARLLLPSGDEGSRGLGARIDEVERRLALASAQGLVQGRPTSTAPPVSTAADGHRADSPADGRDAGAAARPPVRQATRAPVSPEPAGSRQADSAQAGSTRASSTRADSTRAADHVPETSVASPRDSETPAPAGDRPASRGDAAHDGADGTPAAASSAPREPDPAQASAIDADTVRRRWQEVLSTLARIKRATWALVSQNAQVAEIGGGVVRLGFTTPGLATAFRSGPHAAAVQQALAETLGVQARVEPVISDGSPSPATGAPPAPGAPAVASTPASSWQHDEDADAAVRPVADADGAPGRASSPGRGGSSARRAGTPDGDGWSGGGGPASATIERPRGSSSATARSEAGPHGAGTRAGAGGPAGEEARDGGHGADVPGSGDRAAAGGAPSAGRVSADWTPADTSAHADSPGSAPSPDPASGAARSSSDRSGGRGSGADHGGGRDVSSARRTGSAANPDASAQRSGPERRSAPVPVAPEDDIASLDDPDAEDAGLVGAELVAKLLGGTVISEEETGEAH